MLDKVARSGKPRRLERAVRPGGSVAAFQPWRRTNRARPPARALPFPRHAAVLSRSGAPGDRYALSAIGIRRTVPRRQRCAVDRRRSARRGARHHPGIDNRAPNSPAARRAEHPHRDRRACFRGHDARSAGAVSRRRDLLHHRHHVGRERARHLDRWLGASRSRGTRPSVRSLQQRRHCPQRGRVRSFSPTAARSPAN